MRPCSRPPRWPRLAAEVTSMLAVAAVAAFPGTAGATVTFDLHTATGTVDRSDVQQGFGWTNAQFGQRKPDVVFETLEIFFAAYLYSSGTAMVGGPNRTTHTYTIVNSKWQGQYVLSGYGTSTTVGTLPGPGDPCPSGDGST